jgi:hypothetical protein
MILKNLEDSIAILTDTTLDNLSTFMEIDFNKKYKIRN